MTFRSTKTHRGKPSRIDLITRDNDVIWKDALKKDKGMQKAYILNNLDNGNYTIEVMVNKQIVQKTAHVYYKGNAKMVSLRG